MKAIATRPDVTPAILQRIERIEALQDRILRLLEDRRGPRDDADRRLLLAVLESVGDRPFTCSEIVLHAQFADPDLRAALLAADINTARVLGALLRRLHGVTVDGVRVDRVDASRAGAVWSLRVCESDSRGLASGSNHAHDD